MGQSMKTWVGATVVVAFLIGVAGWFLLISPTQAATADTRSNIETEANRTVTLTKALDTLKSQFAKLDDDRAKLDDLSVQVPSSADAAAFRKVIEARGAASGVTIMSLSTGVSTVATPPAATTDTTATSGTNDSNTATPSPTPSPAAEATPAATTTVTTASGQVLVGIPIELTVVGTYDAARSFVASMQVTEGRLFLVYGFNLVTQPDAAATSGRPETFEGDVELSIQGYLLVLTPAPNDGTVTEVTPSPSPAPLPSTERNPFVPLPSAAPAG